MIIITLILSLILSVLSLQLVPFDTLPYQAHSFNDLDIARQLMTKGVKYFKFDASLANEQSCLGYSSWKPEPCIAVPEYAQEMCCLAMRGDASSAPNFHYPFNTSSQFVGLLESFLAEHHSEISILFVAIDFQFRFEWGNVLAEKFMFDLAQLMQKYSKLHVTCKGDYILQYDRVCRYPSAGDTTTRSHLAGDCTPTRKSISSSRFFLQSPSMSPDDPRDYKNRTQNFNIIFTEIDRLCSSGFPQWINRNPSFPLIFWEPSNEQQIQSSLAKLMSPGCRAKHNRTLSGLALASNIDPEMFAIAMKVANPGRTEFPWVWQEKKLWFQNATSMHLAKIVTSEGEQKLMVYRKTNAYNETRHFLTILRRSQDDIVFQEKEIEIHEEIEELRGLGSTVVAVIRKSALGNKKQFDAVLMTLNSELKITALLPVENFLVSCSSGQELYFLSLTSNPQQFQAYRVSGELPNPTPYKLPVFLPESQMQSMTSMFFEPGEEDVFIITGDDSEKTWIARIENSQEHQLKTLTFGVNSQISRLHSNGLIITLENSYNHGGLLMNNNGENACIYHQIPKLKPLSHLRGLVNGLHASLPNLIRFLDSDSEDIVTACHPTLSLAKLFNGESVEPLPIWDSLVIGTRMLPLPKQDLICTLFSGSSNYNPEFRQKKGFLLLSLHSNLAGSPHAVQQ